MRNLRSDLNSQVCTVQYLFSSGDFKNPISITSKISNLEIVDTRFFGLLEVFTIVLDLYFVKTSLSFSEMDYVEYVRNLFHSMDLFFSEDKVVKYLQETYFYKLIF